MLTPIDIQNHTLKTAVRGYSKKETDEFLEQILAGYEELFKENHDLKEKSILIKRRDTELQTDGNNLAKSSCSCRKDID